MDLTDINGSLFPFFKQRKQNISQYNEKKVRVHFRGKAFRDNGGKINKKKYSAVQNLCIIIG